MVGADSTKDFWSGSITEVLALLSVEANGLSSDEASRRLVQYGANRIDDRPRQRLVANFLKRFANPLVLVLLGAAAATALTGDPVSFGIITTVVLLSVSLDFVQEHRAGLAAESLQRRVALHVTTLRDGAPREIPAVEIVPGDIVLLSSGDLIPADCRLIESKDLYVNQALLTGESFPAEKSADRRRAPDEDALAQNGVFMGSSVVSGTAKALVVRSGRSSQLGNIAKSLMREPPPTAFAIGVRDFGLLIVRLTLVLAFFVLLVNLAFDRPLLESLLFALALAVGLTPELLPMIVSVTLARGAMRMSEKQVIVKRLSAIHDLGSMDVLCSDKTGTLTEAMIAVVRSIDPEGLEDERVLELAYLNAFFESGLKSPLDDAILARGSPSATDWTKLDEVPFDFERRRVSVLAAKGNSRVLIVKGAPEDVLKICAAMRSGGAVRALDDTSRQDALAVVRSLGQEGLRALGVAFADVPPERVHAHLGDETNLTLAGFVAFLDPPKESAKEALEALTSLNVAVKIVTGDNEHVTAHVCESLGIPIQGVITGPDLSQLSEEALSARLENVNLLCRVTPAQKSRIIQGLKRRGHVVGYLGDGINDAPSLHAADVGISVDSAVDVAKEAAAMILLEHDLGVLANGVSEGRRTFANIMKYVMMGTSSNFGNMFSMAGGVLFLPFLPMLPVQILLNNLLYDFSEIAIPMDNVDEEMIARPRHWDIHFVRNFMLVLGPVSSLFDFITFAALIFLFHTNEALFHSGWFVESLATQVLVIFVIRTRKNPFASRANRLLAASSLGAVLVAIAFPYTIVGHWFGFVPLPLPLLALIAGLTAIYLLLAEFVKERFYALSANRQNTP